MKIITIVIEAGNVDEDDIEQVKKCLQYIGYKVLKITQGEL